MPETRRARGRGRAKPRETAAVVLRRFDFKESSRIVHLFTRDFGRLSFLAKGAHRPKSRFLGAIDLLHICRARVGVKQGRGLQVLYGLTVLSGNQAFRRDEHRRAAAYHLSEWLRLAAPEGQPVPALYDLLEGALRLLAAAPAEGLPATIAGVEVKLLDALGLLPPLDRCAKTREPLPARGRIGFDPKAGGFVRAGGRPIPARLAAAAAALLAAPGRRLPAVLPPPAAAGVHALSCELLAWHLEARPKVVLPATLLVPARRGARIRE